MNKQCPKNDSFVHKSDGEPFLDLLQATIRRHELPAKEAQESKRGLATMLAKVDSSLFGSVFRV